MISVKWSPVNQAWVVWHWDRLLHVFNDRADLDEWLKDRGINPKYIPDRKRGDE